MLNDPQFIHDLTMAVLSGQLSAPLEIMSYIKTWVDSPPKQT